ncbi:MAG: hypothetical protein APR53_10860 [Methanoculleus sp. SDB]|nr:MAG: hypothetical protein APR53_10860 [Methanoculleus sp. SDB]
MPEVTDDELGRKIFLLQKEKNVEEVVAKLRMHLGPEWTSIPASDREILIDLLGEAWVRIDRSDWEKSAFSRLTRNDVNAMITIGQNLRARKTGKDTAMNNLAAILKRTFE